MTFNSFEDETQVDLPVFHGINFAFNSFEDETWEQNVSIIIKRVNKLSIPLRMKPRTPLTYDFTRLHTFNSFEDET